MNWNKVSKELVYGIHVYTLSTTNKIPYQLTFERDLFFDRVNVNLLPLVNPEKNICPDLRKMVCACFVEFLDEHPDETVYFEIDISYKEGELKMLKFLRWIEHHKSDYIVHFELTKTAAVNYMEVYIRKRSQ